jgi:hypothetical protein
MSFSSHFGFLLVLADEATKMFIYIFKSLTLQTETIVKKITHSKSPKMKNELTKICNEPGNNVLFRKLKKSKMEKTTSELFSPTQLCQLWGAILGTSQETT